MSVGYPVPNLRRPKRRPDQTTPSEIGAMGGSWLERAQSMGQPATIAVPPPQVYSQLPIPTQQGVVAGNLAASTATQAPGSPYAANAAALAKQAQELAAQPIQAPSYGTIPNVTTTPLQQMAM